MRARVVGLLLVLALVPGAMELVELAVHFALYGDVADQDHDEHGGVPLGVAEHGCTGTMHVGACHGGLHSVMSAPVALSVVVRSPERLRITPDPDSLHSLTASAPELRPPIA